VSAVSPVEQSNNILLSKLSHLSRIVMFGALPVIEHLDYVEYYRRIISYPYRPGDVLPTPLFYPMNFQITLIAVIAIDLIVLWKWSKRREDYEIFTSCMFLFELFLLLLTIEDFGRIPFTPDIGNIILLLGVLLFGLLQILLIAKRRFMTRKTAPA